ncbi:MAG TPA: GatB/YqeY domain-containing protein [Acidobacteriaceae bacterium]|nr:GatB/YqeY domain-containing protein [Acidobacteriaceae bacterium]
MSLVEKIHEDMIGAMKQRAVERLSTLRMVKAALKNKEIDQRSPVTDSQAVQVLTTLIKQRRDSIEQFTKGNRPELAEKEAAEIVVIEEYMPKAAGDEELRQLVTSTLADLRAQGAQLGAKDMGTVMKAVQTKIQATGLRADGRVVSEMVKAALAG